MGSKILKKLKQEHRGAWQAKTSASKFYVNKERHKYFYFVANGENKAYFDSYNEATIALLLKKLGQIYDLCEGSTVHVWTNSSPRHNVDFLLPDYGILLEYHYLQDSEISTGWTLEKKFCDKLKHITKKCFHGHELILISSIDQLYHVLTGNYFGSNGILRRNIFLHNAGRSGTFQAPNLSISRLEFDELIMEVKRDIRQVKFYHYTTWNDGKTNSLIDIIKSDSSLSDKQIAKKMNEMYYTDKFNESIIYLRKVFLYSRKMIE